MVRLERVPVVEYINGEPVYHIGADPVSDDWLRYNRLRLAAEKGDRKALEEMRKMESGHNYRIVDTENKKSNNKLIDKPLKKQ